MDYLSRIVEDEEHEHIRAYGHTFTPPREDHDNRVSNQYRVFSLPVGVFIDEAGMVRSMSGAGC